MAYELYYWTGIMGRGEYVRLPLEATGTPYADVARDKGDGVIEALAEKATTPSFAPPVLKDGEVVVGQTAAILLHLGPKLGLVPRDARLRLWVHQIQLTIADLVVEAHDTHHPISVDAYYEEQKPAAKQRAAAFRAHRMPKFLSWFETVLTRNPAPGGWLAGRRMSYADLSLFQVVGGLHYAFPNAWQRLAPEVPHVAALAARIEVLPALQDYLHSQRRMPHGEEGLFRHYPELDDPAPKGR